MGKSNHDVRKSSIKEKLKFYRDYITVGFHTGMGKYFERNYEKHCGCCPGNVIIKDIKTQEILYTGDDTWESEYFGEKLFLWLFEKELK